MVKSDSVDAAPVVAKPAPPPPAEKVPISEELRREDEAFSSARRQQEMYGDGAFFTAPLPVERLRARPFTSQRPRRPVEPRLAWPARPATAPASVFARPTRVRAVTGGGPTHISRPCSAQRSSRAATGVTLDEYLASSGVAVPRPHDLLASPATDGFAATDGFLANRSGGRAASTFRARVDAAHADREARVVALRSTTGARPATVGSPTRRLPRSPPRTPSPPERKAQRRHSPIPADASAGQIRAYHRRQALSPARQRTVRTQSFRALPNCPYKSSDRRKEHLRRIMLNA